MQSHEFAVARIQKHKGIVTIIENEDTYHPYDEELIYNLKIYEGDNGEVILTGDKVISEFFINNERVETVDEEQFPTAVKKVMIRKYLAFGPRTELYKTVKSGWHHKKEREKIERVYVNTPIEIRFDTNK